MEFKNKYPHKKMYEILAPAYQPCENINICKQVKFDPEIGHVPRGFLGCTSDPSLIKVVLIFAEPGHPQLDEKYTSKDQVNLINEVYNYVYQCFKHSRDQFHSNTRWILDQIFPRLTFDQQLNFVWLTEGRLCSIDAEIGHFRDQYCSEKYLKKQLDLIPHAPIIAFGQKARDRIDRIKPKIKNEIFYAYSLSPPGCNHKPARKSWLDAIKNINIAEIGSQ